MRVLLPLKKAPTSSNSVSSENSSCELVVAEEGSCASSNSILSGDQLQATLQQQEGPAGKVTKAATTPTPVQKERIPSKVEFKSNNLVEQLSGSTVVLEKETNRNSSHQVKLGVVSDICVNSVRDSPSSSTPSSQTTEGSVSSSCVAVASTSRVSRKRRSFFDFADAKLPSCNSASKTTNTNSDSNSNSNKKARNKPSARETENLSTKKPAALKATTTPTNNMTGGRRKVTDRQRWQNYYVDNRDAPNENDPASARGDYPSVMEDQLDDEIVNFKLALKGRGLEIVEQDGDGNCLFRAVSLQVYGDSSMHNEVRKSCLDFMSRDEAHFSQFIEDEPFKEYILRKRQDGVHGNNPEIQAISELFNRPVEVFVPQNGASPLNIFHSQYKTEDAPIRLSYHDGNHYNAVIDPLVPTAGLGLGLPGLQPGLADKMQMAKAVAESDILADQMEYKRVLEESQNDELQRAIKDSSFSVDNMYKNKAIALSDLDATNFELEQAVLESSLQSFRTHEHGRKQSSSNRGRRRQNINVSDDHGSSNVASIPLRVDSVHDAVPPAAAASSSTTASSAGNNSAAASSSAALSTAVARIDEQRGDSPPTNRAFDEYPDTVNELVMNGFELRKVIHAYELIGDNFDNLLSFLMSTSS